MHSTGRRQGWRPHPGRERGGVRHNVYYAKTARPSEAGRASPSFGTTAHNGYIMLNDRLSGTGLQNALMWSPGERAFTPAHTVADEGSEPQGRGALPSTEQLGWQGTC